MKITYGWSLMLIVVFCVLYFRYLDAKADGRLDDGIDPPWMTRPRRALAWRHDPALHCRRKVQLTDDQWREKLTPAEFAVLRQAGTERPFVGEYTDTKTEGVYECRACGAELFRSTEKFESHCGWPSFFDPADSDAVILRPDDSHGHAPRRGAVRQLPQPPRATCSRARAIRRRPISGTASTRSR